MPSEIAYFEKERTPQGITHIASVGKFGAKVVIIDDMLDTGGTLVSACEQLIDKGVREIYIMVTHGLFTGSQWKKLWVLRVKTIFCTDTVPLRKELEAEPIETISATPLIQSQLKEMNRDVRAIC